MSFELEYAQLIQKYLNEVEHLELTIEEILYRPRWKRVWYYWKALEHYEGKKPSNLTVDDVKDIYGE